MSERLPDSLHDAVGDPEPWRARAESIARMLLDASHRRVGPFLDVQRAFAILPPETRGGEAVFRLTEALPRTRDRANRLALLADRLQLPSWAAALALPVATAAVTMIGRQFVYSDRIEHALARAKKVAAARQRFSFDMLGEGARSAADADRYYRRYLGAIEALRRFASARSDAWSQRLSISLKLSSIHCRYDAASYPRVREEMLERLRTACEYAATADIGLTIDAEETERTPLMLDLFAALALDPAFVNWRGLGIAVQAYQRNALSILDRLFDIARRRRERGGAPIAIRLVKGAYWDIEIQRAQELGLDGYPVYTDKRQTDLSYLACARRLLGEQESVFPQFATHNPATLACVLAMAEASPTASSFPYECQRLHGMGRALYEALQSRYPNLAIRTYAPVGEERELLAYLARRLLENGASTSYVRQAARTKDSGALIKVEFEFLDFDRSPRGLPEPWELHMPERRTARGYNLGDPSTLAAIAKSVAAEPRFWQAMPLVNGKRSAGIVRQVVSPARPEIAIGGVSDATPELVRAAISAAHAARARWARTDVAERAAALDRLAELMEKNLAGLMALCVWEAGKTLADSLSDVREAIDYCRYYAAQARERFARPVMLRSPAGETNALTLHGRGVFACISPWNFPVAIFTGQVAAALVAGNTVVAKPAEQTPLAAFRVAELMLEAGIPPDVLHLLPGDGETVGRAIVADPRIAGVALTGSTETARAIQRVLSEREGPIVPLIAETGGVNTMVVDSTALPEQVVDAVVTSAFRSAGQRCSSLRVLYLQHEIAPAVIEMLRGAVAALRIGDPSDPSTDIGPVIDEQAREALRDYVSELRRRAALLVEAGPLPASGSYVAPVAFEIGSIREVPGERFGPILHVVRFAIEDLERVIDDINSTGYGLTMGVQTRVQSRAEYIRARSVVGNLYVNRSMIGAVVGLQPFGGEGLSGTGPKAGGPNYLPRFATERVCTVNTAAAGGDLRLVTGSD